MKNKIFGPFKGVVTFAFAQDETAALCVRDGDKVFEVETTYPRKKGALPRDGDTAIYYLDNNGTPVFVFVPETLFAFAESGEQLIDTEKMPRIVNILLEMYPELAGAGAEKTMDVLKVTQRPEVLLAIIKENRKECRFSLFGHDQAVPLYIAEGLLLDFYAGMSLDEPGKEDLPFSRTLRVAEVFSMKKEKILEFCKNYEL